MSHFVVVRPEQVNGKLAAIGGKILLHLPNYTEVLRVRPTVKDDALQVFAVAPIADELREVVDNGRLRILLWKGDMTARSRPHEIVSVEVLPLPSALSADEQAKASFGDLPKLVQLAGVLETCSNEDLLAADGALKGVPDVRAWSRNVLTEHVQKAQ